MHTRDSKIIPKAPRAVLVTLSDADERLDRAWFDLGRFTVPRLFTSRRVQDDPSATIIVVHAGTARAQGSRA